MKKSSRILALALCLLFALGSLGYAADDWADYQQYVISFAEAGAPTPADAEEFTNTILSCPDMDSLLAGTGMGVIFEVMGALQFDGWLAAGKPAAGTDGIAAESSADKKDGGIPSGDAAQTITINGVEYALTVYVIDGVSYVKLADLQTLTPSAGKADGMPAASSDEAVFAAYIEYMRSMLQEGGEGNDDFKATLDAATPDTYDETQMPYEMFISLFGAMGFEEFKAYYAENGASPDAPEIMAAA